MTVYAVIGSYDYDGGAFPLVAFADLATAEHVADSLLRPGIRNQGFDDVAVYEIEVRS